MKSSKTRRVPHRYGDLEFLKQLKGTLPDTIGDAELSTLNAALGFLFGKLREARTQFDQEDNGRLGAFTALGALWKFITLFRTPYIESLQVPILPAPRWPRRDP